jgi:hypothetical protein
MKYERARLYGHFMLWNSVFIKLLVLVTVIYNILVITSWLNVRVPSFVGEVVM